MLLISTKKERDMLYASANLNTSNVINKLLKSQCQNWFLIKFKYIKCY